MDGLATRCGMVRNPFPSGNLAYRAAVLADSPSAYWRLNESSGSAVLDESGNGNNATYDGATLNQSGIFAENNAAKTSGSSNPLFEKSGFGDITSNDFTLEMWLYPTRNGSDRQPADSAFLAAKGFFSVNGWYLSRQYEELAFVTSQTGDFQFSDSSSGSCPLSEWTHFPFKRSGARFLIYINALDDTKTAVNHINPTLPFQDLAVGARPPQTGWTQ